MKKRLWSNFLRAYSQGYPIDEGALNGLSQSSDPEVASIGRKLLAEDKAFSANYAKTAFGSDSENKLTSGEESVITGILLLSGLMVLAEHLAPEHPQSSSSGFYSNDDNERWNKMRQDHIQLLQDLSLPTY